MGKGVFPDPRFIKAWNLYQRALHSTPHMRRSLTHRRIGCSHQPSPRVHAEVLRCAVLHRPLPLVLNVFPLEHGSRPTDNACVSPWSFSRQPDYHWGADCGFIYQFISELALHLLSVVVYVTSETFQNEAYFINVNMSASSGFGVWEVPCRAGVHPWLSPLLLWQY